MIHVALASADPVLLDRLAAALLGTAEVGLVDPRLDGVRRDIARIKPATLVIDMDHGAGINAPVRDFVEAARSIDRRLEVLALGDIRDPAAVLQAIRGGAADVFDRGDDLYPVRAHMLRRAVNAAEERAAPGAFTLVLNGQPGCGENLLSLNLALMRARSAGEGLLVDCALPGDEACAALGLTAAYTLYDAVRDLNRLDRTFVQTALAHYVPTNLRVLPLVGPNATGETLSPDGFLGAVNAVRVLFQQTVLNAGGLRHTPLLASLAQAATEILLVCQQKITALRDCKALLAALPMDAGVRERITVVIDDYDDAINLDDQQIRDSLGLARSHRLPSARPELVNGLNLGRPFVLTAPRSPYVAAFEALAFPDVAVVRPRGLGALKTMIAGFAGGGR